MIGVVATIGSVPFARAQEMWLGPREGGTAGLEVLWVNFKSSDFHQPLTSAALFLTGRAPLGGATLVVEVPAANGRFTSAWSSQVAAGTSIGDPYIGIETGHRAAPVFAEVGVRVPLMSESDAPAMLVGTSGDLDREDAFLSHIVTASAFLNYRAGAATGLQLRVRAGPLAWFASESRVLDHPELFGVYALQAGYVSSAFEVFGGLSGRAIITEQADNQFTDQFVAAAHLNLGPVEPGVSVRLPLDNGRPDVIGSAIGFSLRVGLP